MATTYAIPDGRLAFDVVKTTATVSTGTTVSGLSFSPGLLWRKNRDNVESHYLVDSVRGTSTGGYLSSNSTAAAAGYPGGDGTLTFNSDGYTITETNWNAGEFYFNGRSYVDWLWKAGGTPASNTAGSITSSVSANTTAGFSVVQFTATGATATVGHGLGVAPQMIIVKDAASAGNWAVWHTSLTSTAYYLFMNTTAAQANTSAIWTGTPSSTTFGIGSWHTADRQIAYCFAPVAGYSAFGSYTGNGSADGPFVYTAMRPRFIMLKRSDTGGANYNWFVYDSARNTFNATQNYLEANLSTAEQTGVAVDFLSNGFKVRTASTYWNASGGTFIYMAFAEVPFAFANAR